ncbi:MAG: PepSY domain-containing protein, partial [Woeseiaceae bacterium]
LPARSDAFALDQADSTQQVQLQGKQSHFAAQNGGMTLAQAIESVRRRTNGRVVSAETRVKGGREVHYIKVLTKDGKVKTHTVNGQRR